MIQKRVILSIKEQGSLVRKSGLFPTEVFEQGKSVGTKDSLVKNGLVASIATRKVELPEETVSYLTSEEGCPKGMNAKHWASIPDALRLRHHLVSIADNCPFTYKLV